MKLLDWATEEFGDVDLGDVRRSRRVVALAATMAAKPGGRVTSVVSESAEREAAFRLLRNPAVDESELARSSHLATLGRLGNNKLFLVAVDQTGLTVTDTHASKGFGRTGSKPHGQLRGLQVMTAMAVSEDGSCLGLCGQKWWCRPESKAPNWNDDHRPLSKRESWLWHAVIDQTELALDEGGHANRAWYQLDRGGDSYHILSKSQRRRTPHHSAVGL